MNKKGIGYEINLPENGKLKSIPMTKEAGEKFKKQLGKSPEEYLKEYIDDKDVCAKFDEEYERLKTECLPENLDCAFCKGGSTNKDDKACTKYYLQMNITFSICTKVFVDIVQQNKRIFEDKKSLKRLAGHFLKNFHFYKGMGVLWFDLYNFQRNILEEGFAELTLKFKRMPVNEAIRTINDTKADIELRQTLDELYERTDPNFLALQRRFYKNKLRHYEVEKNVQLFEKRTTNKNDNQKRPNSMDIALCVYYKDELNKKISVGNLTAMQAWEQIGMETNKSKDNIRKAYSKIIKTSNRVNAERVDNLKYVASNMLNECPICKAKAIEELEIALLK